jgi:hypothetical protein
MRRLAAQFATVGLLAAVAAPTVSASRPRARGPTRSLLSPGQLRARSRSPRIRWAASLPGAPVTQPPGCVPEPHW